VDLIVYLRTTPEVAHERILRRKRLEESAVPFSYVCDLHELHEDWLARKVKFQPLPAPVVIVEANGDLSDETVALEYDGHRNRILQMAQEA